MVSAIAREVPLYTAIIFYTIIYYYYFETIFNWLNEYKQKKINNHAWLIIIMKHDASVYCVMIHFDQQRDASSLLLL